MITSSGTMSDSTLLSRVNQLADKLSQVGAKRVASQLDNGADWLVADLALRQIDAVHIPLPTFFSPSQIAHALQSSGAHGVLSAQGGVGLTGAERRFQNAESEVNYWSLVSGPARPLPSGISCITYTSGTTGRPKGVCLGIETLLTVAQSLVQASSAINPRRHLCLMPLSTLLENVAGLYATLLADAQIVLPAMSEIGYTGASNLDVPTLLRCLHRYQPESVILVPQLLLALVMAAEHGASLPNSLRYLAVGGGRVGLPLLARARAVGLPVFEGYGLTECGSVVSLNSPGGYREGSVGKPLPHASISFRDGEMLVDGARALGYLDGETLAPGPIPTGDLGHVDAEGYLHITGRRKNVFITAFGRNVSPEWVESELIAHPSISQAIVWGEGQADNVAVIVPRRADASENTLIRALEQVNVSLPDYARIARFVMVPAPFRAIDGLLTGNGRPRREAILSRYQAAIDEVYRRPAPLMDGASA